jgi:adenylate kinase
MGLTLVSGVPGVGASTVCDRALDRLGDVQLVNFRDVMLEQAVARGVADRRADLAGLSARETRRLQRRAGEFVADRAAVRDVLLNAVLATDTDEGYLPGLTSETLDGAVPDRFVLLEAAPETVARRRAESDRDYGDPTPREVRFQQELNRTATASFAADAGRPVHHVENEGSVEDAADALVAALGDG